MLRSALVPTDMTPDSALMIKFVSGLTALGTTRVVLAYVVEASGMEGPVIAASVDRARDQLRTKVTPLTEAGLDVEVRIGTGDPTREILALAAESRVESIVSGSHAKTGITRLISGSVSEDLVAAAERPTMLARFELLRNAADPAQVASDWGRVLLFPTDFSASATRAMLGLLDLPKGAVQTLVVLHVLESGLSGARLIQAEESAKSQLKTVCDMAKGAGMTVRCVIRQGDPRRVILHELDEQNGTGIITGTRGQSSIEHAVLGSVSLALVRQASCPVLIAP